MRDHETVEGEVRHWQLRSIEDEVIDAHEACTKAARTRDWASVGGGL